MSNMKDCENGQIIVRLVYSLVERTWRLDLCIDSGSARYLPVHTYSSRLDIEDIKKDVEAIFE